MEGFTQGNPTTLRDVDLNEQARNVCIESILSLLYKVDEHGGKPASTIVYVEEGELGILTINMRVRLPELGSITIPLIKVGPMYWRWRDEGEEH